VLHIILYEFRFNIHNVKNIFLLEFIICTYVVINYFLYIIIISKSTDRIFIRYINSNAISIDMLMFHNTYFTLQLSKDSLYKKESI